MHIHTHIIDLYMCICTVHLHMCAVIFQLFRSRCVNTSLSNYTAPTWGRGYDPIISASFSLRRSTGVSSLLLSWCHHIPQQKDVKLHSTPAKDSRGETNDRQLLLHTRENRWNTFFPKVILMIWLWYDYDMTIIWLWYDYGMMTMVWL